MQSRAAGFLEGSICQERIYQTVTTQYPTFYPKDGPSAAVLAFLNESMTFKLGMIAQVGSADPYWGQLGNILLQVQGIFEGYSLAVPSATPEQAISFFHVWSLQLDVDIGDVTTAVGLHSPLATEEERALAQQQVAERMAGPSPSGDDEAIFYTHCSVLVKPTPGNAESVARQLKLAAATSLALSCSLIAPRFSLLSLSVSLFFFSFSPV